MAWSDDVALMNEACRDRFGVDGIYSGESGSAAMHLDFSEDPVLVDAGGGVSVQSIGPRLLGVPEALLPDGKAKRGHTWTVGARVYRVVEREVSGPGHVDLRLEKVT